MIKQNKGKDLKNIPESKLSNGPYYVSCKYDGHYIQIQYHQDRVFMSTSGGKAFYLHKLAEYIKEHFTEPFHIECEYLYGCEGKLGDRGKSARLTTYRTNYAKGIRTDGDSTKDRFVVLDMIDEAPIFKNRLSKLQEMFEDHEWFHIPKQELVGTLATAKEIASRYVNEGFEGAMLKAPDHIYQPGKRVNNIVKIKPRLTADLLCVDVMEGTGKYEGMVGALLLEDTIGRLVSAGSGLSDYQRSLPPEYYVGKVVEIEYERIDDTYIQPIIKGIRDDKTADQID